MLGDREAEGRWLHKTVIETKKKEQQGHCWFLREKHCFGGNNTQRAPASYTIILNTTNPIGRQVRLNASRPRKEDETKRCPIAPRHKRLSQTRQP